MATVILGGAAGWFAPGTARQQGSFPSLKFQAVRWRLAVRTQELLRYPATNKATAPSVLIPPLVTEGLWTS